MRRSFAKLRSSKFRVGLGVVALGGSIFWAGTYTRSAAQIIDPTAPNHKPSLSDDLPNTKDPLERQRLEKLEKARQADRQQQLVRDTDKLLDLAKQLKDQVDKSNKDTLSIDVVKKAAEIEKLARNVKDRMKG
jgi:hypothetical protein